ncbi:MAG: exodeoxyribonuclease VII small subunit [Calditrichales bacterium]|nr:MAG: exodeoxyribonuclease VII small subunit [Calditrichales bacterium]
MNKNKSFEEAVERLDEIVARLENGEIKLDEMVTLYEEGASLIKFCLSKLDDVEKKINVLRIEGDGRLTEAPYENGNNKADG